MRNESDVVCLIIGVVSISPVLYVVLRAIWLHASGRYIRRVRSLQGLCPKCGYDLRGTPDRCPDSGAAPENSDNFKLTDDPDES